MKKIILALTILLSGTLLFAADPEFPALTGPVVDRANLLSAEQIKLLSAKLISFEKTKGSQIAICIVPTIAPLTIEDYGIKLAEKWKIGRAKIDDGIIIIIAKNDRKMRIEVGYGLEHAVTDLRAGRIVSQIMAPEFRKDDYYKGIDSSVDSLITFINGGDIPAISSLPAGNTSNTDTTGFNVGIAFIVGSIMIFIFLLAIGKLVLSFILTYVALCIGLYLMGVGMPAEVAVIGGFSMIPFIIIAVLAKFAPAGTSSGSSGYSSSSSSSDSYSSSSSSSSDSSSYSGGGGDFGGGGASGDW